MTVNPLDNIARVIAESGLSAAHLFQNGNTGFGKDDEGFYVGVSNFSYLWNYTPGMDHINAVSNKEHNRWLANGGTVHQAVNSVPSDPPNGSYAQWMDSNGDVYIKATSGGVTKTTKIHDHSA